MLAPSLENSDWWRIIDSSVRVEEEDAASFPPGPLITDPGYVNGLDSALIPLLDGLVHNISCSWLFDSGISSSHPSEDQGNEDPLTAPGFLLEFDFDILD